MNSDPGEFVQTFFGTHLLPRYADKKVGIVESEKTALVLAIKEPKYLWLATGGSHGCRWYDEQVYNILQGRDVVFFPDLGMYSIWSKKVSHMHFVNGKVRVSDYMETQATSEQIIQGLDLADVILSGPY